MSLTLSTAKHDDAARIAEIHMAAFGSNAMLLAQFPTPTVRNELQKSIELKALADINDSKTTVLVVRDASSQRSSDSELGTREPSCDRRQNGKVIAFAKWAHPISTHDHYVEPPWTWPTGTDMKILEDWTKLTEKAQLRAVWNAPCYRLTFIGTDPSYERRGAATMMVQWGIEQSKHHHVPAYLESTIEAAPFYKKLGFIEVERFSLEYEVTGTNITKLYEEISFIYK